MKTGIQENFKCFECSKQSSKKSLKNALFGSKRIHLNYLYTNEFIMSSRKVPIMEPKFDEKSKVLCIRVPESLYEYYKENFYYIVEKEAKGEHVEYESEDFASIEKEPEEPE